MMRGYVQLNRRQAQRTRQTKWYSVMWVNVQYFIIFHRREREKYYRTFVLFSMYFAEEVIVSQIKERSDLYLSVLRRLPISAERHTAWPYIRLYVWLPFLQARIHQLPTSPKLWLTKLPQPATTLHTHLRMLQHLLLANCTLFSPISWLGLSSCTHFQITSSTLARHGSRSLVCSSLKVTTSASPPHSAHSCIALFTTSYFSWRQGFPGRPDYAKELEITFGKR